MSILSEIDRINNTISLAYDTALAMGAVMPLKKNLENLPSTIATIPSMFRVYSVDDSEGQRILDSDGGFLIGSIPN